MDTGLLSNESVSAEQQTVFGGSYVKFEFCVRRRYNVMTGDTL